MVAEYERLEDSDRWYYSFLGDLYEKEPTLGEWVRGNGFGALMNLGRKFGPIFAQMPPLAHDLHVMLEQWFVRGFYMGMRKYTEQLSVGLGVNTPLSEPKVKKSKKEGVEENWGESEEVESTDFDEPNIQEIEE